MKYTYRHHFLFRAGPVQVAVGRLSFPQLDSLELIGGDVGGNGADVEVCPSAKLTDTDNEGSTSGLSMVGMENTGEYLRVVA